MLNKSNIFSTTVMGGIICLLLTPTSVYSSDRCKYMLTPASTENGTAKVNIKEGKLRIKFSNALPNTLYTVWADFKNRATGTLAADYPVDKGAIGRGVAPAFASTAGVKDGMGLDPNGVVTDDDGDAEFSVKLDYMLLKQGDSPVVGGELAMQGMNRVGGYWLRMYPLDETQAASNQIVDPDTGLPMLHRATAQGLTIQSHPDNVTHGHTPGVGGIDHSSGYKGDFPISCLN